MLYALHQEDGRIHQANKLYDADTKRYDDLLNDLGHAYVKANAPALLPPEHWMVDVKAKEICERPVMRATAYANIIKAGTNALLLNIPHGADVTILAVGAVIRSVPKLDGDELEFPVASVPCKYTAVITLWPFKDCTIEIEAIA
ncbi:hypothetical protein SAMN05444159_1253 [Bradyrhizobium lablabi]|uniref:Uncharacterized protein n=1 Tax=Bradyrhizobium lablabi TaxID=722472 RepID=A0A1M6LEC6_9BRAD|nr:hypothetical protein [Bradyrhizobium lablabi]SHJ69544.1 hypothetical protein SAMN05444159_1253 [Bradyrhizobium lablabi]